MAEDKRSVTEVVKPNENFSNGVKVEDKFIVKNDSVGDQRKEIYNSKNSSTYINLENNTENSLLTIESNHIIELLDDVPPEDFPDMLFRMEKNYPLGIHAHEHVKGLLRWKKSNPDLEMAILSPNGDYKQGVIFYSVYEECFNGSVYCHNDAETMALQMALSQTSRVPLYRMNMSRLTSMAMSSLASIYPHINKPEWCISEGLVLWLPWYCAREIEVNLPDDAEIRPLELEHADFINELWPCNYPGSVQLVREMISVNISMGLFKEGYLLSWALCWCHGGIAMMQTVESEKGKGYFRAVIEAITKEMGRKLMDVHLNINGGKKRHQNFFRALGFRYAFKSYNSENRKQEDKKEYVSKMETTESSKISFKDKTKTR